MDPFNRNKFLDTTPTTILEDFRRLSGLESSRPGLLSQSYDQTDTKKPAESRVEARAIDPKKVLAAVKKARKARGIKHKLSALWIYFDGSKISVTDKSGSSFWEGMGTAEDVRALYDYFLSEGLKTKAKKMGHLLSLKKQRKKNVKKRR